MTFREARRTDAEGFPIAKTIVIRSVRSSQTYTVPATSLGSLGWLFTSLRLRIDFRKKELIMQVPLQDWLLQSEQRYLFETSCDNIHRNIYELCKSTPVAAFNPTATANATLSFSFSESPTKNIVDIWRCPELKLIGLIANALCLPSSLFEGIVRS